MEDAENLPLIFERRSHELKTINTLIKQKRKETARYFELCGPSPNRAALQSVLREKLDQEDQELNALRRRIKDLKLEQEKRGDVKAKFDGMKKEISEAKAKSVALRSEIERKESEIARRKNQNSALSKELAFLKAKRDGLNESLEEKVKALEQLRKELDVLSEHERSLKTQRDNLRASLSANRASQSRSAVDWNVLEGLRSEIRQMEGQLSQTAVEPLDVAVGDDIDELDQVYKDQIERVSQKVDELRRQIAEMRDEATKQEKQAEMEIAEKRKALEETRNSNNAIKSRIEDVQLSIPEALGQITRELEMWRQKLEKTKRSAKKKEENINEQRIQAEARLKESEKKLKQLKGELVRSQATIAQQQTVNSEKQKENENLKDELESMTVTRKELTQAIEKMKNEIEELKQKLDGSRHELDLSTNETRNMEREARENAQRVKAEIEATRERIASFPVEDIGTSTMSEEEVKNLVKNLEIEYKAKEADMIDTRAKFAESERLRGELEASLELISELDEEHACMVSELAMMREYFGATIAQLRAQRKT